MSGGLLYTELFIQLKRKRRRAPGPEHAGKGSGGWGIGVLGVCVCGKGGWGVRGELCKSIKVPQGVLSTVSLHKIVN